MTDHQDPCEGCGLGDRRAFLQDATRMAVGILAGLGLSPRRAAAFPISFGTGRRAPDRFAVSYPIPAADGATIDKENQVIVVRFEGKLFAFALSCPHQNTALKWDEEDHKFKCPKHKSQYEPDGTFIKGRATRNMDRMPVHSDGKTLTVDVDHVYESDKDPKGWAGAEVKL